MEKNRGFARVFAWVVVLCLVLPLIALGSEANDMEWLIDGLWEKFGIEVTDAVTEKAFAAHSEAAELYGSADNMRLTMLQAVDKGLSLLSPELYKFSQTVKPLNITLSVVSEDKSEDTVGEYDTETSMLFLYAGTEPLSAATVMHEYAHLLTYQLLSLYGGEKALKAKWMPLNNGIAYSGEDNYEADYETLSPEEKSYFCSDYAMASLYEDIAETFSLVYLGLGETKTGGEVIEAKVDCLGQMFDDLLASDPSTIVINPDDFEDGGVGEGMEAGNGDDVEYEEEDDAEYEDEYDDDEYEDEDEDEYEYEYEYEYTA